MPSMACENCHMICGFSGLPKFRQLVARHRSRARASHFARGLGHGVHRAQLRIEIAPASIAIERHRQPALRARSLPLMRITPASPRPDLRPCWSAPCESYCCQTQRLQQIFGLASSCFRSAVKSRSSPVQLNAAAGISRGTGGSHRSSGRWYTRRIVGQRLVRNFGDNFAVMQHAQSCLGLTVPTIDGVQSPLLEDAENFVLAALFGHQQHALLRLAEA